MTKKTIQSEKDISIELAKAAIHGIEEKKGKNIKALDLRHIPNTVCDFFIICEGDSTTQVSAIADSVADEVKKLTNKRPHHIEGMQNAEWVLVDYIDVVVHVFQPEVRHFYKLESLWADAEVFYPSITEKKEVKVEVVPAEKKIKKTPVKKASTSKVKSNKKVSTVKKKIVKAKKTKTVTAKKKVVKKAKAIVKKKTAVKKNAKMVVKKAVNKKKK